MGKSEIKGLLEDPHAPSPLQASQLGSRNALSPMRASLKLRGNLGHVQVDTQQSAYALRVCESLLGSDKHLYIQAASIWLNQQEIISKRCA